MAISLKLIFGNGLDIHEMSASAEDEHIISWKSPVSRGRKDQSYTSLVVNDNEKPMSLYYCASGSYQAGQNINRDCLLISSA